MWREGPHKSTQARPNPNYHYGTVASYHRRSSMATTFQCHYIGPKPSMLRPLATTSARPGLNRGVSNECWILLQQRLLTAAGPWLADPHFAPAVSPVGILRHSIRAFKTLHRAQAAAAAMGRRLLLSVAADRCTFANRPLALTSELAQEADAVHTLSATANLPDILALYPGVELCLETKVCSELGVVRGCPVLVEDILLPENEPFLILHLLYRFFTLFCFPFIFYSYACLVLRRLPLLAHASTEVLRLQPKSTTSSASAPSYCPTAANSLCDLGPSSILPLAPDAFSSAPGRTLGDCTVPAHHRKDSILTLTKKLIFNCVDVNFRSSTHLP